MDGIEDLLDDTPRQQMIQGQPRQQMQPTRRSLPLRTCRIIPQEQQDSPPLPVQQRRTPDSVSEQIRGLLQDFMQASSDNEPQIDDIQQSIIALVVDLESKVEDLQKKVNEKKQPVATRKRSYSKKRRSNNKTEELGSDDEEQELRKKRQKIEANKANLRIFILDFLKSALDISGLLKALRNARRNDPSIGRLHHVTPIEFQKIDVMNFIKSKPDWFDVTTYWSVSYDTCATVNTTRSPPISILSPLNRIGK
jgi:hypothetical protein